MQSNKNIINYRIMKTYKFKIVKYYIELKQSKWNEKESKFNYKFYNYKNWFDLLKGGQATYFNYVSDAIDFADYLLNFAYDDCEVNCYESKTYKI